MADLSRVQESLSSRYWALTYLERRQCGATLFETLSRDLPHIPPASWPQRLLWGGLYLNGRAVRKDVALQAPCRIEYYEPKFNFHEAAQFFPQFTEARIVFEDEDLLAVSKPAGLPCLPAREQQSFNLKRQLEAYISGGRGLKSLHFPSRIDAAAEGLVLVSKSPRSHAALQQAFEKRQISKFYLLHVCGKVSWQEILVDRAIIRDPAHPVLRKIADGAGQPAITRFICLGRVRSSADAFGRDEITLLQAQPVTGRTHQIRVHSASLGLPIIGDNFYQGVKASVLRLLSYRLEFLHPLNRRPISIKIPPSLFPRWLRGGIIP